MKKAEIIIALLAVIAIVFNLFLIPGGSILTLITLLTLSAVYFYLGFALFNDIGFKKMFKKNSYKSISALRIIGAVGTGIALSFVLVGIVFKIEFLPGADIQIKTGLVLLSIVFIIALIKFFMTKAVYYKRILLRITIIGSLALYLAITPATSWIEFKYRNHPEYVDALKKAMNDRQNRELWEKVAEEREKF